MRSAQAFSAPILGKLITPMKILVMAVAPLLSLLGQTVGGKDNRVTVVKGESWINHLNTRLDYTSMGRTWSLGPPPSAPGDKSASWQPTLSPGFASKTVTLHGSDVYRLNCRGCHQESGHGAPPEINSVINPVRATSVPVIIGRMKDRGVDMSRADATVLAKQASSAVLQRLHEGGKSMPSFPHLSEAEIRCLIPYLKQLAGVPGAEKEQTVVTQSSSLHIGEQIVKSTCHICHDATGPNPSPEQILKGAIPPLSTLTTRTNMSEFVRKVTRGAPIVMGAPPMLYRGRMSVFYYLSDDEAASAYLYLMFYPPEK
jgi:mono/diheme cytochrome c family protein